MNIINGREEGPLPTIIYVLEAGETLYVKNKG